MKNFVGTIGFRGHKLLQLIKKKDVNRRNFETLSWTKALSIAGTFLCVFLMTLFHDKIKHGNKLKTGVKKNQW